MTLPPALRKFVLTAHITASVGWLGAVLAYLALDLIASMGNDVQAVRGAYFAMEVIIVYVIVPLALTALLVGIVNALGAPWGLLRHYWVVVKLLLTLFATTILLLEVPSVRYLAKMAASAADPRGLPGTLPHSIGGAVILLIVIILSAYKPRGMTPYGWRKEREQRRPVARAVRRSRRACPARCPAMRRR